jgi:hypothetical protein
MRAPTVRAGGGNPRSDGDINLYISPEGQAQSWFNQQRRVVFVNGMANTADDHAKSARALSLLQACPVVGIYNRTDGTWADLGQCLMDKITLVPAQAGSFSGWKLALDAAYVAAHAISPSLTKIDFVGSLIAGNQATLAVYSYVVTLSQSDRAALKLYCHSQGNLITSNALTAVALALGASSISGLEVNSFGSPCRFWPEGLNRTNYAFTFDPVSWLDYNAGFSSVKIGFVAAHAFDIYMRNDAEFVVNRFRWGSFGLTASMDEEGLADYMVGIGNNPPRLKGIVQRLLSAHWSDSDDVAYYYVNKMRTRHGSVMQQIARGDPGLIRLLYRCLDEGITTPGERTEMNYLNTL